MPSAGFEPTIPPTKQPQTYALDRAATGIGTKNQYGKQITSNDESCIHSNVKYLS
jgi:hypothetical protein